MARTTASPSIPRFLARVGIHSRGTEILFLAVALYGAFEWYLQRHSETALYVTLFSIPFAAGTGLITIAKAGQLDLLIGAGASRFSIWLSAMVRSVALPVVACVIMAAVLHGPGHPTLETSARAAGIATFTGGLGFALGMWHPRYALGVVWIAARLGLILSGVGVKVLAQLKLARAGGDYPPMSDLFLSSLAFPEILLDPTAHGAYVTTLATVGFVALATSLVVFRGAELTGRRSV